MNTCVMITAIGDTPWVKAAIEYAYPVIKKYFNDNGHDVFLITDEKEMVGLKHPSWTWLRCHHILPGYDYILTWNLDIVPVKFDDDIFDGLDFSKMGAIIESDGKSTSFPHYKYNCGLVGVPNSMQVFCDDVTMKWSADPKQWPSWEQYYVNFEIGEQNIPMHEIPRRYGQNYSNRAGIETCWHYTQPTIKEKQMELFKQHYDMIFGDKQ